MATAVLLMGGALIANGKQQFFDGNGNPLAGGSVYFYVPNTTTPQATYQDQGLTVLNANPVVLDASGSAVIWGNGLYRQQVYDVNGNLIWDQETGFPPLPVVYTFDLSAPPSADVPLNPGDKAIITFTAQASMPLTIATAPGLYKITMAVTASDSTDTNLLFEPNNATYSDAFSFSEVVAADQVLSAFGSAIAVEGFTQYTESPYISAVAEIESGYNSASGFYFDLFVGPNVDDTINDIGPFMFELLASTATPAKFVRMIGGVMGGPALSFASWSDTTTPWTSLGTLTITNGTSYTGVAVVERLA